MKKSLLLAMSAIALLSSCNSDDIATPENDVLVVLGAQSPTITTRSSIDNNPAGNNNWIGLTELGIYGLDKNTDWTTAKASDPNVRLIDNEKSTIQMNNGSQSVSWSSGINYVYPLSNDYKFTFFGYHPYVNTPTVTSDKVVCTYTLTGTQDIIWAEAWALDLPTGFEGFNAKYIRKGGSNPSFNFKHLLSRFTFSVLAGGEDEKSRGDAAKLKVKYIRITDVRNNATLVIADKVEANAGKLTFGVQTGNFELCDKNDSPVTDIQPAYPAARAGESIMVPASPDITAYEVEIRIEDETGTRSATSTLKIEKADKSAFAAGDSHNVKLTVYGLTDILISASLTEWSDKEEIELPDIN